VQEGVFARLIDLQETGKAIREIVREKQQYTVQVTPMIIDGVVTNSNIISECNRLSISTSPSEEHAASSTEIGTKYRVWYNIAMQVAGIRNPP